MTPETVALPEIYRVASFAMSPVGCHFEYLLLTRLVPQPVSGMTIC